MKALVLSGGGSKGSYQIGVWKALKKLRIKFDIVTGTSVGALNGALITQKSYFRAIKLWKKINLKLLFGENAIDSTNDFKVMTMYGKEFFKNGGMEVKELEKLIEKEIKYKKIKEESIYQTLIEKAISINHKSREKPVTMQVAGFFFASIIFKKCPQLIENKLCM